MAHTFAGRWFRVLWLPVLAGLLWLGLTLGLYSRAARVDEEHRLELERIRLSTVARQLLDARNWNAAHGGVYVPESDLGRPNPWLPLHERTLKTADGRTPGADESRLHEPPAGRAHFLAGHQHFNYRAQAATA